MRIPYNAHTITFKTHAPIQEGRQAGITKCQRKSKLKAKKHLLKKLKPKSCQRKKLKAKKHLPEQAKSKT